MDVTVVVGNPKPSSRTLGVATTLADGLAGALPGAAEPWTLDLAQHAGDMFDWKSEVLTELTGRVAASDLLVVASPTYKGSYTGLLKAFFDRYPSDGLAGVVAVTVMTGAAAVHALAVEVHLRPLLVDLGATVPARGLFVTEAELPRVDAVVDGWMAGALPLVQRALGGDGPDRAGDKAD